MAARPPVILEEMASPWGRGPSAMVNRYSLNPVLDWLKSTFERPSLTEDPAPTMFASGSGDLPVFTASGADPDLLRWVHWGARHTAAQTTNAGLVYALIEASAEGADPAWLQTPEGRRAYADYVGRMWRWAAAGTGGLAQPMTGAEYDEWQAGVR